MKNYLAAKVVVLGVEKADQSCVDGALLWHLDSTIRQYPQHFGSKSRQISFQNTRQSFQVALQRRGALK